MNIKPIQQNNTNFEALHAPEKLWLFKTGTILKNDLLASKSIRECANKYDVFVTKRRENGTFETIRNAHIGGGVGLGIGTILAAMMISNNLPILLSVPMGVLIAFVGYCYGLASPDKVPTYDYLVQGRKDDMETKEHLLVIPEDLEKIPSLTKEIEAQRKERFIDKIAKKYPEDGIFTTKNILSILEDKSIKRDYTNDEIFNFHIDIDKTSSLLMKFFDIKKTEENAEEYDKIASIIKSTPNINFRQQDNVGISIIENILNSENADALEIVKDISFPYTPYFDTIFNNIQDEDFKKKALGIKIVFPSDAIYILHTTKSIKRFQEAISFLDSPFCNSREEAIEIWTNLKRNFSPKDLKELNAVLYKYLPENLRIN